MSQELKQDYDYDWGLEDLQAVPQSQPKFHEYQDISNDQQNRWEELTFFVQISSFCLSTSLFAFLFLALNFPSLLALIPALILGVLVTYLVKELLLEARH